KSTKHNKSSGRVDATTARLDEIARAAPRCAQPRAAVVELRGPGFFGLTKTDDPKAVLRKGMALANRRLQCLRPITEYHPKPDAKRVKDVLPGTRITIADASRASAAIHDALRQLGRVGTLAEPPGLASGCELIGIWLEHFDGADVPIIVRITTEGTATAQIAD